MVNYQGGIVGVGVAIPEKKVTNDDLSRIVNTSDDWIVKRTGIKTRFIAGEDELPSKFAIEASKHALESARLKAEDLNLILCGTSTPDYHGFPTIACLVQDAIGAKNAACHDLYAACSGFGFALDDAFNYYRSSRFRYDGTSGNILIIGSDCLTKMIDFKDRETCVLFGDAAGAIVLSPVEDGTGLFHSAKRSDGSKYNLLTGPTSGNPRQKYMRMKGKELYQFVVSEMPSFIEEQLKKCNLDISDVRYYLFHQANLRMIESIAQQLRLPPESVYTNIDVYGNTSSASTILALHDLYQADKLKKSDILAFVVFGAGLTWSMNLVKWTGIQGK